MRTRNGNLTRTRILTASASVCCLGFLAVLSGCGSSDAKTNDQPGAGGAGNTAATSAVGSNTSTSTTASSTSASGGSGATTNKGTSGGSATGGSSSKSSSGSATGGSSSSATGPGLWALINVDLASASTTLGTPDDAKIAGFPKNGPPVPEYNFKEPTTVGDCKLYQVANPYCDPKCATGTKCVGNGDDGTCATTPTAISMGTLTVEGLKLASGSTDPFTLTPINNSYESAGSTDLDINPCAPGDEVKVAGGADDGPKFEVKSTCIERLKITSTNPHPFEPDKKTTLTWEPPSVTGKSRVTARFDISHHGGLGGIILCDTDDDGSLEVDGSLVSGLISFGTAGYPIVLVTRVSTGKVSAGSGEVILNVQSKIEKDLKIPGIDSCANNDECANSSAGPVCNSGRKCAPQ